MSKVQTDNSFLWDKVQLRINHLPEKEVINVLDVYGGDGRIWDIIKTRTGKQINILRADHKSDKKGIYLHGDNRKFLKSLDLQKFDIIDLDAYDIPFEQLNIVLENLKIINHNPAIFVTFIQVYHGNLPHKMLKSIGYTDKMIKKIPTLFMKNGFEKFKNYLSQQGIKEIIHRSAYRKHYIFMKPF